jgi:hypothetical protein
MLKRRNPEKNAIIIERQKQWAKKNKGYINSLVAARKAQKLKATPPWADLERITWIYDLAARRSRREGVRYDVDHVLPLQGKNVCGLHTYENLVILPASDNIAKGNRVSPELLAQLEAQTTRWANIQIEIDRREALERFQQEDLSCPDTPSLPQPSVA